MSEKKHLTYMKRFRMYLKIIKKEPQTWTKEIHGVRIFMNIFTACFSLGMMYSLYYHHYNPRFSLISQNKKFIRLILFLVCVDSGLIYLNYHVLHKYVYMKFYSELSDRDFSDLFHHVVTRDNIIKEMNMNNRL